MHVVGKVKQGLGGLVLAAVAAMASPAQADPGDWVYGVNSIPNPVEPPAVSLPIAHQRALVTAEGWASDGPTSRYAYNVGQPSLIPIPATLKGDAAAPAVILVPGGGFLFLSMDNEGYQVAQRLAPYGVRVFVLKYRTQPMPGGYAGFHDELVTSFRKMKPTRDLAEGIPYAAADTEEAVKLVRARAAEWHVDPNKVGIVGFSAGAMTVLATVQQATGPARPDFVGMIYGPTQTATVPANPMPMFAALAADDRFFGKQDLGLVHAWRQAGGSIEGHLYASGGHGFASTPGGNTSDLWFDQMVAWMKVQGFVPEKKVVAR